MVCHKRKRWTTGVAGILAVIVHSVLEVDSQEMDTKAHSSSDSSDCVNQRSKEQLKLSVVTPVLKWRTDFAIYGDIGECGRQCRCSCWQPWFRDSLYKFGQPCSFLMAKGHPTSLKKTVVSISRCALHYSETCASKTRKRVSIIQRWEWLDRCVLWYGTDSQVA